MDERMKFYLETVTATMERTIKRLWILALVLVALLVISNGLWIWYESQFVDEVVTVEQEADGSSRNFAVGGDYYGGTSASNR